MTAALLIACQPFGVYGASASEIAPSRLGAHRDGELTLAVAALMITGAELRSD